MADLLSLEVDLVYFDTTCTYFELDLPSDEGEPLRKYGHSKDHRPDRPQTVIGQQKPREALFSNPPHQVVARHVGRFGDVKPLRGWN